MEMKYVPEIFLSIRDSNREGGINIEGGTRSKTTAPVDESQKLQREVFFCFLCEINIFKNIATGKIHPSH